MRTTYYLNLNQQVNGDYEVHAKGCSHMPLAHNREELGNFNSCSEAVAEAKRRHPYKSRINGCYYCCRACHTS